MWVIPKSNPDGRAFIAVLIVFLFLAFSMFALRLVSRRLKKAILDASDYICCLGLVSPHNSPTPE